VLPRQCLKCGVLVGHGGELCSDCWRSLTFLGEPLCHCCGLPFDFSLGGEALCAPCLRRRPGFDHARAALVYDDASRSLILGFKHGDRTERARAFAAWVERAGASYLAASDLIVPVPLHRARLRRRRYNQAALIANELARNTGACAAVDLLRRTRNTSSQGGLNRSRRRRNVQGAFEVAHVWRHRLKGSRVTLVDDVLTTGATAEACALVLRRQGAVSVVALTVARVVRPRHSD
jgi:ComF family protein